MVLVTPGSAEPQCLPSVSLSAVMVVFARAIALRLLRAFTFVERKVSHTSRPYILWSLKVAGLAGAYASCDYCIVAINGWYSRPAFAPS
jgi:hypothetical protein